MTVPLIFNKLCGNRPVLFLAIAGIFTCVTVTHVGIGYSDEPAQQMIAPQSVPAKNGLAEASHPDVVEPDSPFAIRISADVLARRAHPPVDRHNQVRRVILETNVVGQAHTSGKYALSLVPCSERAMFQISLVGETVSRTDGHNGPVVIDTTTSTKFQALKLVAYDPQHGFYAGPSTVSSQTTSVTNDVQTNLRGFLDRIIRRRAWEQIEGSRAQANSLAQADTEKTVHLLFDAAVDQRLAQLNKEFDIQRLVKLVQRDCQVYTTDKHVVVWFGNGQNRPVLPESKTSALVELCVHKSVVGAQVARTVEIADSMKFLGSLFQPSINSANSLAASGPLVWMPTIGDLEDWISIDLGQRPVNRVASN